MRPLKFYGISLLVAAMLVSVVADSALAAVRAPLQIGSDIPYYYISKGISDNGKFPYTWVGFYWSDTTGTKTINYNPRMCNDGGYDDKKDADVAVTIYGINADGTTNTGNVLYSNVDIEKCHNNNGNKPFSIDLSKTAIDTKINMKGVVVYVHADAKGKGNTRAWFSLESPDSDAAFGVIANQPAGYSRDVTGSAGEYYDLQTGFGSCTSSAGNGTLSFFDTDNSKYQSAGAGRTNALTIGIKDLSTNGYVSNTPLPSAIIPSATNISTRSKSDDSTRTQFNIDANSGQVASLSFNMAANRGYQLDINHLREGNDITVQVPSNEIYGKIACRNFSTQPSEQISVDNGSTWQNSSVSGVSPGTTILWRHAATVAAASTSPAISYGYGDDSTSGTKVVTDSSAAWSYSPPVGGGTSAWQTSPSYVVPSNAANGAKYCRQTYASPMSDSNSAASASGELCATVSATWTVSGYTIPSSATAVPGDQVTFTHHVVNSTPSGTDQDIWSDTQVSGGLGIAKAGHNNGKFASGQDKTTDTDIITIPNGTPVGTQYCQRVGYAPYAYDAPTSPVNANYRNGIWACVTVAAAPYVSVVGGNVWAGGSTVAVGGVYGGSAGINGKSSINFGSFGEYGVFATDTINYFGSAGQLGIASGLVGSRDGARLTFASASTLGSLGKYTNSHKITDLAGYYNGATTQAGVYDTVSNIVSGSGIYVNTGGVGTNVIVKGIAGHPKAILYVPNGKVTIMNDITYDTLGVTTFKDLPSLTIVAKDIVIDSTVSEIAGNFYASGSFVTCDQGPRNAGSSAAIATTGVCHSKQLTINGAVTVANQTANPPSLVLNRSIGGTAPSQAAEIIRMRPEVFLTQYENSSSLLTTVKETELPARY